MGQYNIDVAIFLNQFIFLVLKIRNQWAMVENSHLKVCSKVLNHNEKHPSYQDKPMHQECS